MSGEKDTLLETYGLYHCTQEQLSELEPNAVVGYRKNDFGAVSYTHLPAPAWIPAWKGWKSCCWKVS